MTLHCKRCNTDKPVDEFFRNAAVPRGRQAYCKKCWSAYTKPRKQVWEKAHKRERLPDGTRRWVLRSMPPPAAC